jgi:hypothetical protein
MKPIALRICLFVVSLLLGACLGGREEFWFERDGSGRLQAEYRMPVFAIASMGGEEKLRKTIVDFFATEPGVVMETFVMEKTGAEARLRLHATFDSVLQLSRLMEKSASQESGAPLPEPMVKLLGEIQVARSGLDLDFQRKIDPREVFAGGLVTPTTSQMRGYQLEYIMHLPMAAKQSNAHQVSDSGHTLLWRYELAEAMKSPVQTNFLTPIPIPLWSWLLFSLLLIGLIWLLGRWLMARNRTRG